VIDRVHNALHNATQRLYTQMNVCEPSMPREVADLETASLRIIIRTTIIITMPTLVAAVVVAARSTTSPLLLLTITIIKFLYNLKIVTLAAVAA